MSLKSKKILKLSWHTDRRKCLLSRYTTIQNTTISTNNDVPAKTINGVSSAIHTICHNVRNLINDPCNISDSHFSPISSCAEMHYVWCEFAAYFP